MDKICLVDFLGDSKCLINGNYYYNYKLNCFDDFKNGKSLVIL